MRVETKLEKRESNEHTRSSHRPQKQSKGVKPDRPRNTLQSLIHDPGGRPPLSPADESNGLGDREVDSKQLPTTVDLAQSFLQAEPQEETEELESAIANSRYLGQSSQASESEDETAALGVGNALSLPGFLADFLKGVGDRLQLKVTNVRLDLNLDLDIPLDPPEANVSPNGSEVITIRLSISNIGLQGITAVGPEQDLPNHLTDIKSSTVDEPPPPLRQGIRCVSLDNIQVMLVSDSSLFANLTRFGSPSSPVTTHGSFDKRSGGQKYASTRSTSTASSAAHGFTRSTKTHDCAQPINSSSDLAASLASNYSERFSGARLNDATAEKPGQVYASSLGDSRYQDSLLADSFYPDSEAREPERRNIHGDDRYRESLDSGNAEYREREPQVMGNSRKEDFEPVFDKTEKLGLKRDVPSPLNSSSIKISSSSQGASLDPATGVNLERGMVEGERKDSPSSPPDISQSGFFSSYDSDSVSSPLDDLTQSRIFSQEEAASVYMSAISHISSKDRAQGAAIHDEVESNSDTHRLGRENKSVRGDVRIDRAITPILEPILISTRSVRLEEFLVSHGDEPLPTAEPFRDYATVANSPIPSPTVLSESMHSSRILQPCDSSSQDSQNSSSRSENSLIILKRFVSMDSITLKLPQEANRTRNAAEDSQMVAAEREPLISTVGTAPSKPNQFQTRSHENITEKSGYSYTDKIALQPSSTENIEQTREPANLPILVDIGSMEILGDVGLTKLTILIIQQHMELFQGNVTTDINSKASKSALAHLKMKVRKISWKFLDSVKGFTSPDGKVQDPVPEPLSFHLNAEVLLQAAIDNLQVISSESKRSKNTSISMGKFSFGYSSENILSFNSELKMRESTRDILAPVDNDLVITINQTSASSKIDITTLPLHISLDLRRLDEIFAWFGGFSSILGLGSSMMSTVTVVNTKPGGSQFSRQSRGVHFETSVLTKSSQNQYPAHKITARIGSLVVILQGANCTLRLESTAMKLVSRAEGVGLQIDKLKFTGPYLRQDFKEPSIAMNLANIRMEYLSIPKEVDLARLLALLSPSNDKYEQDDDILLDTLLRQRRQGGIVRLTVEALRARISNIEHLQLLSDMAEELKKLSTVTKYLPEDERPGILTLGLIRDLHCDLTVNDCFGVLSIGSKNLELAHVSLPSLTALGINFIEIHRNYDEELLGETLPPISEHERQSPMIMARFVGNEMEPVVKVKILNARVEYLVSTTMAMMGLSEDTSTEKIVNEMVSSVVTLTHHQNLNPLTPKVSSQTYLNREKSSLSSKPIRLEVSIRDSTIGLNPRNSLAKGLIVLTSARLNGNLPPEDESNYTFEVKKASLMIIDNQKNLVPRSKSIRDGTHSDQTSQLQELLDSGFVSVSYISSAKLNFKAIKLGSDGSKCYDIEIRDDLFVLESCADSTQTLMTILNGLKPPVLPSTELKYRTEIVPVEDMLASFSGNAFAAPEGNDKGDYTTPLELDEGDMVDDEVPQNLEFVSSFYNPDPENLNEGTANNLLDDELESLASPPATREIGDRTLLESFQEQYQVAPGSIPLDFQEDHFGSSSTVGGTAHRWDIKQNTYSLTNELKIGGSPLRLRVRDVHIIWNLFDGYDWQHTRDTISKAVAEVEIKAAERFSRHDRRKSFEAEDEEDSVIGDFLFNSIYIGIPANRDPKDLARQVNRNIDDLVSETESFATSSVSGSPSRQGQIPRVKGKRLRLTRSKYHKMTFELKGVSADLVVFPPDTQETQSSIDVRIQDLDIFDHVPTSTWKKFATYMHDAGERESGTSMVHLEILNVKPVPNLAASEIILKVQSILLRCLTVNDYLGHDFTFTAPCRSRCS